MKILTFIADDNSGDRECKCLMKVNLVLRNKFMVHNVMHNSE